LTAAAAIRTIANPGWWKPAPKTSM
jgi:hypothetical protein